MLFMLSEPRQPGRTSLPSSPGNIYFSRLSHLNTNLKTFHSNSGLIPPFFALFPEIQQNVGLIWPNFIFNCRKYDFVNKQSFRYISHRIKVSFNLLTTNNNGRVGQGCHLSALYPKLFIWCNIQRHWSFPFDHFFGEIFLTFQKESWP